MCVYRLLMWLNEMSFWLLSVCDPLPNWHILVMEDTSYIYILNLPRTTCSGVASPKVEWAFLEQSLIKKMNYRITTDDPIKVFSKKKKKRFFPDHTSLYQLGKNPKINQDNDPWSMWETLLNNNLSYFVYPYDLILILISQCETFQPLKVLES